MFLVESAGAADAPPAVASVAPRVFFPFVDTTVRAAVALNGVVNVLAAAWLDAAVEE